MLVQFIINRTEYISGIFMCIFADDISKFLFAEHPAISVIGLPYTVCAKCNNLSIRNTGFDILLVLKAFIYTQGNARFALTVEPDNAELQARAAEIDRLRAEGRATVPSTMGAEKATNPFLRPDSPGLMATLGMPGADPVSVFAETRRRKDRF